MKVDFSKISKEIGTLFKEHKSLGIALAISTPVAIGLGAWLYFRRKSRIVRYAKKFIGEEEIRNNMGFINDEFEKFITQYGDYNRGQKWCMSFAKSIWLIAFGKKYRDLLDELLTPSTQTTWENFKNDKSGKFKTSKEPSKGAIVIWQYYDNGSPTWQGHAGIVQNFDKYTFSTIEGNTSAVDGIDRVAEKKHTYKWDVTNGLRLKGFISVK